MKKGYEILFITKPNLNEEEVTKVIDDFKGWIEKNDGQILMLSNLGKREIATPIKHTTHGIYVQCHFMATQNTLDVLKKNFSVSETIIRELTVTLDSVLTESELESLYTSNGVTT